MTQIALLRHFPTDWNGQRRLQGRTDRPLTDTAREMLSGLALPTHWSAARIISSPLSRARETAERLAEGRPVDLDPRLVELSWGAWEGRQAHVLLADPSSGFKPTGDMGWNDRPPGGESLADAWARVRPALSEIVEVGHPTVIVTHKALMRVLLGKAWSAQPAGTGAPEIKRGRLYPMGLSATGLPRDPGEPLRLEGY